jgi:copper chaperone CopZ
MKKVFLFMVIFSLGLLSCKSGGNESSQPKEAQVEINPANVVLIDMDVNGMTCTGCENTIKSGVSELSGVVKVEASHTDAKTYVKVDTSLTTLEEISQTITSKGYKVVGSVIREAEMEVSVENPVKE